MARWDEFRSRASEVTRVLGLAVDDLCEVIAVMAARASGSLGPTRHHGRRMGGTQIRGTIVLLEGRVVIIAGCFLIISVEAKVPENTVYLVFTKGLLVLDVLAILPDQLGFRLQRLTPVLGRFTASHLLADGPHSSVEGSLSLGIDGHQVVVLVIEISGSAHFFPDSLDVGVITLGVADHLK